MASDLLVIPRCAPARSTALVSTVASDATELALSLLTGILANYCQAYHGGANRAELIQRLIRTGTETREELLYKYPWPARDPNGHINVTSMLDMQAWYKQNKFGIAQLPAERLADTSYADYAAAKLGPFVVENHGSKLAGCRYS